MSILVGPNNAGKSTIIGALRLLAVGLQIARSRRAAIVQGPAESGQVRGYRFGTDTGSISLENVYTNYDDSLASTVTFRLSNGNSLMLYFPEPGECFLVPQVAGRQPSSPSEFNRAFPISLGIVPVLGPVEHEEQVLTRETVTRGLNTHRASRHFRNYWSYFPERFGAFRERIQQTWPGMDIQPPERADPASSHLAMFCLEDRIPRELYWAGFGFQVWCQILTHIARSAEVGSTLFVIDEPEIYLHPDLQRQLLSILRQAGPDVVLATHSSEIVAEADPSDVLIIDKRTARAERVASPKQIEAALHSLGSIQNTTLTQLARLRRALFVEGDDFKLLRRFGERAQVLPPGGNLEFAVFPCQGFPTAARLEQLAEGMRSALGVGLTLAGIFDRDYRSNEEIARTADEFRLILAVAHIYAKKEIENYLLVPEVIDRAIQRLVLDRAKRRGEPVPEIVSSKELLIELTQRISADVESQMVARHVEYFARTDKGLAQPTTTKEAMRRFSERWNDDYSRLDMVPGKQVFASLATEVQERYGVSLTSYKVIDQFRKAEVPYELVGLLKALARLAANST